MIATGILKLLAMLILVAGINMHFKEQQSKRRYPNLYPEFERIDSMRIQEIDRIDSMVITKFDSALTHIER